MENSEVKQMLERLHEVLKAGPSDRFRSKLRVMITEMLHGKRPIVELADGIRPLLKEVALSFMESGNINGARAAISALRCRG